MLVDSAASSQTKLSGDERAAIQEQLERLLANPHFKHSRRFPSFLRYIIEQTLSGQTDLLKERTLGIEIFGRDADYDTASDPIVRVTAAEIRKRIAQYYLEPGHEQELRISLPLGSYIPQFQWLQKTENNGTTQPTSTPAENQLHPEQSLPLAQSDRQHKGFPWAWGISLVFALLLGAGIAPLWKSLQPSSPFDAFWAPVLSTSDPVLICVADQSQYTAIALRDGSNPDHQILLKDNLTAVVIDDLNPVVHLAGSLQARGKKYLLKGQGATTLMDLRNGPTIFVGAFDNAWTLRLTNQLRYHFANNPPELTEFSIVDGTAPAKTHWTIERAQQLATNNYRDYALIARFTDTTTGKLAVIAAGVGRGGTIAAGEFLTDPANLTQLQRILQNAGNKKNFEIVLSTEIIGGESGTPKVEATYFW